jgi:uncharacterized membrane protein YbhN (UPF0104 family)
MAEGRGAQAVLRRLLAWLPGLLALIALAIVLLRLGELERLAAVLGRLSPVAILLAALPQLATYAAAAAVWYAVLRRAAHRRHLAGLYVLGIAKLFMDQALPSGGLSGSLLILSALQRRGISRPVAVAALLIGAMSFHLALVVGAGASLGVMAMHHALSREAVAMAIVCLLLAVALLVAIPGLRRREIGWLDRWLARLPAVRRARDAIREAPSRLVGDVPLLLAATLLQLTVILLDGATLWILLRALGAAAPYGTAFAAFVLASIIADIVPIPLGLGSFEAALVGLLGLLQVDLAVATGGTLLFRGLSFWLPMLPGVWLARREVRGAHRTPPSA